MKNHNKEAIYLPEIYASNMVIQRELPIFFWGKSKAGEKIQVKLDGQLVGETKSNKNGYWKVEIEPQLPGGPHCIEFQSKSAKKILDNVLFGDVWICSGQSNMEWTMDKIEFAGPDIEASTNPRIRLFNVARIPASKKINECSGKWMECTPENVRYFSAVGYYFGKELEKNIDIPIGLINTSWGGTKAEAWTSKEALLAEKSLSYLLNWETTLNKKTKINLNKYLKIADYRMELTRNNDGTLPDPGRREFTKNWEMPFYDDSKWIPFKLPSDIEQYGLEIDGAIWFRKKISLPSNFIGKTLILSLGAIDDFDITFFNGQEVGRTGKETQNWWVHTRKYTVPASLTKQSDALIAVRVFDHFMKGGIIGPEDMMKIYPEGEPENTINISGEWRSALEIAVKQQASSQPKSTQLFNGMINPLLPMKIKGAIWYQGESNADKPVEYKTLLKTMIKDWRARWNSGKFPFYIVQLANYMQAKDEPSESMWAQLRNSQMLVAKELENCALATAIDIGDADDIHPRNKKDVGKRLALHALRKAYYIKSVHCDSPFVKSAKYIDGKVIVEFETEGFCLKTNDGKEPRGFAISGGKTYFWAKSAKIAENKVIIELPEQVSKPVRLRYAWADNPQVNLYDETGLPVLPFEIEII